MKYPQKIEEEGEYTIITIGPLKVQVKQDEEGVVVDIFPTNPTEEDPEPLVSTWVLYQEAEDQPA